MLEAALAYARLGWSVFPLSASKKPLKGSHGFKDASTSEARIREWFPPASRGRHNLGLATGGDGPVVLDGDGAGGIAEFEALCAQHGQPELARGGTLTAATARGRHWYFILPPGKRLRSRNARRTAKGGDGLDIKADKGYVVIPPSVNWGAAGGPFTYRWMNSAQPAVMPDWLIAWCEAQSSRPVSIQRDDFRASGMIPALGQPPAWLAGRAADLTQHHLACRRVAELPGILEALRAIPGDCGYDRWFEIGAALWDWDSGDYGLAVFKAWSASSERHGQEQDERACEDKWREYTAYRAQGREPVITVATLYAVADQHREGGGGLSTGAASQVTAPVSPPRGEQRQFSGASWAPQEVGELGRQSGDQGGSTAQINGHGALHTAKVGAQTDGTPLTAADLTPVNFPDKTPKGKPLATMPNAQEALHGLGLQCRYDAFHDRFVVGGRALQQFDGSLGDYGIQVLRDAIVAQYHFDPGKRNTEDAAIGMCLADTFDPVLDYLDGLQWDGVERINRWVCDYLGAPDTPLNREVGRLALVAAVRRARVPGCKFDQIIVLEGPEGTGKSSAVRILAGDDNFSDQHVLAARDREQQEAIAGVWLYEIAELRGLRRAEVEKVKQFASRLEDRARPAFGRFRKDLKRRCVFFATTNENAYLQSDTGNRRFWPIATGTVHLGELMRDRDQLWAEAAAVEKRMAQEYKGLTLDPRYWEEATAVQLSRMEDDPWEESVLEYFAHRAKQAEPTDLTVTDILTMPPFQLNRDQIHRGTEMRINKILYKIGYERFQKRVGQARKWCYRLKTTV